MSGKLTMANLIAGIGAAVTLLFSFFGFYKAGDEAFSAWDQDVTGFASAVPAILALALLILIGVELAGVVLPEQVLTFTWPQIKATWGISAAGLMLSWLVTSPLQLDKSAMFWLQLLGSLAMAVGTIMTLLGKGSEVINFPQGGSGKPSTETPPAPPPPGVTQPPPPPSGDPTAPPGGTTPPPPPPSP